ncbi:hypothetical protein DFP72DRAFT_1168893 [Ephemerocybe angulata]|uniref:NmrA-like domain-containing protein n=1 Tax=Ephemerocybe angulata TaxID=980116 RepID=A0A8H6I2F2_9AGAR|nr:hypothetical protein DFP72DRAFT_1168893 [Tulosesus angulatus]
MSVTTKIFLTGATGYIGGSVVAGLLAHPEAKSFELIALVRDAGKADKITSLGVKTIVGSYSDLELLTKVSAEVDIVIAMAVSDSLGPTEAILQGLKKKYEATSKAPIIIHTSGAGIVSDLTAAGGVGTNKVYSDLASDDLATLPGKAVPMTSELALIKADEEGYVKSYFIAPSTIYGLATGPLVDLGVQHRHSVQFPPTLRTFIARKRAGTIGSGKNVWPAASYEDNLDLYMRLFDAVRKAPGKIGHGKNGFFFVESCEYNAYEVAEAAGKALKELGVVDIAEPDNLTDEEKTKYFGPMWVFIASTARVQADRGRSELGWKPVHGRAELFASIKPEIVELLKA